jgi:telomerase reverse transcriptase
MTVEVSFPILTSGHPEYGCSVNMAKSLTNFDVTINAQKAPRLQGSTYFPFCGNLIDVATLNVIKDFTRLDGTCKNPGAQN